MRLPGQSTNIQNTNLEQTIPTATTMCRSFPERPTSSADPLKWPRSFCTRTTRINPEFYARRLSNFRFCRMIPIDGLENQSTNTISEHLSGYRGYDYPSGCFRIVQPGELYSCSGRTEQQERRRAIRKTRILDSSADVWSKIMWSCLIGHLYI